MPPSTLGPEMKGSSAYREAARETRVVKVDVSGIGKFQFDDPNAGFLGAWRLQPAPGRLAYADIEEAASLIRHSDVPVAFPTETVYGLGADATRSSAVKGIFQAKQRPSDNPLIVHISSLSQLCKLLDPHYDHNSSRNPIPQTYYPLIQRFWPGPLTVLLSLPTPSPFAPEVTAGLSTVGVRMPCSTLALALIQTAEVPLAAPSANASTKPSPTTAAHVLHDLNGRIDLILDGGPCDVGVESTVVDGLHHPPLILRPGGVSSEMLRELPGWENVQLGYQDRARMEAPKAPGMKYKHYSPKARVILFKGTLELSALGQYAEKGGSLGVLLWSDHVHEALGFGEAVPEGRRTNGMISDDASSSAKCHQISPCQNNTNMLTVWTIKLGPSIADIARGLFSALRELDSKTVTIILVESMDELVGDAAAAVMNRLRKAAENEIDS